MLIVHICMYVCMMKAVPVTPLMEDILSLRAWSPKKDLKATVSKWSFFFVDVPAYIHTYIHTYYDSKDNNIVYTVLYCIVCINTLCRNILRFGNNIKSKKYQ